MNDLTTALAKITARLEARLDCILTHSILKGDRSHVSEPDAEDEPIRFQAELDREAGTARLVDFPPVRDAVETDLGEIKAEVRVEKSEVGTYDAETGHVSLAVRLAFDPDGFLARTSKVDLTLSTQNTFDEPEHAAEGAPLSLKSGTLRLVGEGTFDGGSLMDGTLFLAIDCAVLEIG